MGCLNYTETLNFVEAQTRARRPLLSSFLTLLTNYMIQVHSLYVSELVFKLSETLS